MFASEVLGVGSSHSLHSKCLTHFNVASSLLQIVTLSINPFYYPSGDEKEKRKGSQKHCDLKKKKRDSNITSSRALKKKKKKESKGGFIIGL